MPSFDVVSELDFHEVQNSIDQAQREVSTRFDFKGVEASFVLNDNIITSSAEADIQLQQMLEILQNKLTKRGIDIRCMTIAKPQTSGKHMKQTITLQHGLETDLAKKLVKIIKNAKLKVQATIQGDKLRITGKKRDDLQQSIALLKESNIDRPLQYNNFRD